MNLNELKSSTPLPTREAEFIFRGDRTGLFLELRHASNKAVEKFNERYNAKIRDLTMRRKLNAINNYARDQADELRIAHVAGWRYKDGVDEENGRPEFSKSELRELLKNDVVGFDLRKFIDEEVANEEDFLPISEDN